MEVCIFPSWCGHNPMNEEDTRNLLRQIRQNLNTESFYKDVKTITECLDCILSRIALLVAKAVSEEQCNSDLKDFLLLLVHLLRNWRSFPFNKDRFDVVRFCEIFDKILKTTTIKHYLSCVTRIITESLVLSPPGIHCSEMVALVNICCEKNMQLEALVDMCTLMSSCLELMSYNGMSAYMNWILTKTQQFLRTAPLVYDAVNVLQTLLQIYNVNRQVTSKHMLLIVDLLIHFSCEPLVKTCSRTILSELIIDFASINQLPFKYGHLNVNFLVENLPMEMFMWHKAENDMFFAIAMMLDESSNCKHFWSSCDILRAINHRLQKQNMIPPMILKSICYLFPLYGIQYKKTYMFHETSVRLISQLECCGMFKNVVTLHEAQLVWLLESSASLNTKMTLLEVWLGDPDRTSILCQILFFSGLEKFLLDYICRFPGRAYSKRAASVIRSLPPESLGAKVTMCLFQSLGQPDLCFNLLLSAPGVPENVHHALLLCTAMGALLPHINDRDVFVAATSFSKKILYALRRERNAALEFCKNFGNLNVIIGAAFSDDDEVGASATSLLRTLLSLQARHDLSFEKSIDVSLTHMLKGSTLRKMNAMKLIKEIVKRWRSKNSFINYEEKNANSIYVALHTFCGTELAEIAYSCMLILLKGNSSLARLNVTYALMIMQWQHPMTCANSNGFLNFADHWFFRIKTDSSFDFPPEIQKCFLSKIKKNRCSIALWQLSFNK